MKIRDLSQIGQDFYWNSVIKIPGQKPGILCYSQLLSGGPDGELGATLRYLSQRYSMPYKQCIGILNDIGTEEIGHFEMIATIVHQLTRGLTIEQIKAAGFQDYFVDHTTGLYTVSAAGVPFDATCFASKGDAITDLMEDMAAEQKARTTYDNILRLADDPDVIEPIRFLREREVVHFQRFGEALRVVQDNLDSRNFYAINPEFDGNMRPTPYRAKEKNKQSVE